VMFHKAAFTRPDGTAAGLVGVMLDITERKRLEDNLRQAATVFESSAEGVTITKPDGAIIAVNRAFTEITGYEESEVLGLNPRLLQSGRHDKTFYREMWASLFSTGRWRGEIWNRRKCGELYPEWLSIAAVHDKQGRLTNYVATFSDITQHKRTEEQIRLLAFSDPLTGLPNRRLLLDRLQHALAASARNKRHGALFFIDLDDFKDLNDTLGHDKGDLLLQQVARRLAGCIRESDTVARLGGDEFVVMLEDLDEKLLEAIGRADSVGEKILSALNQPYMLGETKHHSTPSIGVTLFGDQHTSVEELLKQADLAMYQAKKSGRNALRFFDPEMQTVVAARVAMEADLRQGIEKNQFVLHYQPQVDRIGRTTGVEALIRWNHPQRGIVLPAEFIPLAEDTGLILPLGLWALDKACAQLNAWARRPETAHLTMAVNVSAQQFRQRDFYGQVLAALDGNNADPRKLKLELTESLLLDNVEEIITKMTALKEQKVGFSLDDFGTGYSALQRHQHLVQHLLRIAEQHAVVLLVEERIVHAGVAGGHAALHDDRGLGLPDFQHRHAGDRAGRVVLRRRVHDVVGADHHGDVGGREVVVELVHFQHDVVGHLGFGQQHVHVAGHAPRHRMDAEADVDALLAQVLGDLVHRVLGLRHRHAVAGNDDHALGLLQQFGGLGGADRHHFAGRLRRVALGRRRAPPPVPKPPAMTLMKLRFIALHMM
jgi:diguanylate cyclase (GGDEF)-like protein/PAS domain S-box-containing protein